MQLAHKESFCWAGGFSADFMRPRHKLCGAKTLWHLQPLDAPRTGFGEREACPAIVTRRALICRAFSDEMAPV